MEVGWMRNAAIRVVNVPPAPGALRALRSREYTDR
jgi:hypothetical protein